MQICAKARQQRSDLIHLSGTGVADPYASAVHPLLELRLAPVVDATFPFDDACAAYHAMRAAGHFGKLVIEA